MTTTTGIPVFYRETKEFLAVHTARKNADGTETVVTDDVELCLLPARDRPENHDDDPVSIWSAAVPLSGELGIMVENMEPGTHRVWRRVTSFPEIPVECVGSIQVI